MDAEVEESISLKRRKTEISERDNSVENDEPTVTEDQESFLQDFLSKKPKSNLSLFQKVLKQEEQEAKERDPAEDLKLYRDACADFSDCVSEIAEIKAVKTEGWKDRVNEIRKEAAFLTLIMKKLNRVEKTRTKISREKICKERQKADLAKIKLDNMLCEMQHKRKEIDKCLKFRCRPLGIDLISVNEFYEKAPVSISKPDVTKHDEHQLQLARLEWELKQRKELAALLNDLENKKSLITEQINKKDKDLNSLGPLIKDVLMVTQPLKEKLGISSTPTTISDRAAFLPDPLYFLYVHASAYSDACEKDISLEIKGDFAEARRWKIQQNSSLKEDAEIINDRKENTVEKNDLELEQKKLLSKHPFSVHLKLPIKDGCVLDLQFYYLTNLYILTVIPSLLVPPGSKTAFTDIIVHSNTLLHNLFSGDSGQESPNVMNSYQLLQVSLEVIDKSLGFPYVWVQRLGGLNFCTLNRKVDPKQDVARTSLPVIIKELKRRCLYRLSLLSLVEGIEQGNIIAPKNMKSLQLLCALKSLKGVPWADFSMDPLSEPFKKSDSICESDIFLKATITRGEDTLTCFITVKADYPLSPCIFVLNWVGSSNPRLRNSYCMDIEREVNLNWKELLTSRTEAMFLLSYQLFKTMLCFDIVLESLEPNLYKSNKVFTTTFSGRTRALPFKYVHEENIFVHRS